MKQPKAETVTLMSILGIETGADLKKKLDELPVREVVVKKGCSVGFTTSINQEKLSMKNRKLLAAFVIWVSVMLIMVPIIPAIASDNDKLALLLARTCVAEIGLHEESTVAECELMWQINRRRAIINNNRTIGKQTRLFNSFWKVRKQRARRPYVMTMNGSEKPRGWPRGMRWDRYVDKWLTYRRAAIAFARNPEQTAYVCPEAIDYGAPNEIPKASNLDIISCLGGKTRQWYWGVR